MNRAFVLAATVLAACHRPTEIRGVYLSRDGSGVLFPCDDARRVVDVPDSGLAVRYHAITTGNDPAFVRLHGKKVTREVPREVHGITS